MTARGPGPFVALAVVVAAAVAVWLLVVDDDDDGSGDSKRAERGENQAKIVGEGELTSFAGSVGHVVYWAGPDDGAQIELTNTDDGSVYVRYLSPDAEAGDPRPEFLTVGTYPVPDALEMLENAAGGDGYTRIELEDGGVATYDEQRPSSIHFAYPDSDFEVEVFDPSPERALELVTKGEIQPVG